MRLQPDSPLACLVLRAATAAFFLFLLTQRHTVHTITQQLVRTTSATTTMTHTQRGTAASVLPKLLPPSVEPSVVAGYSVTRVALVSGPVLLSVVAGSFTVGVILVGLFSMVTVGVGLVLWKGLVLLSIVARSFTVELMLRAGLVFLSMVTRLLMVGIMLMMGLVLLSMVTEPFTVEVEGLMLPAEPVVTS